jgi:phosphopantothenoylcysteine decarboxylase/phosphopantothenate--cysteine ligase
MMVLNSLRDAGAGFGTDTNLVTIITADEESRRPLQSKQETARDIIDALMQLREESK